MDFQNRTPQINPAVEATGIQTHEGRQETSWRPVVRKISYSMPAVSGLALTGMVCLRGRISENPNRKMAYAVRTPNAIEPTDAHTNINKFRKSAILFASVALRGNSSVGPRGLLCRPGKYEPPGLHLCDSLRYLGALTPVSVAK